MFWTGWSRHLDNIQDGRDDMGKVPSEEDPHGGLSAQTRGGRGVRGSIHFVL